MDRYHEVAKHAKSMIILRKCRDCYDTHKLIYYKRIKNLGDFDIYNTFIHQWTSENNEMGTHFNLYSTLEDALSNKNEWKYCNYYNHLGGQIGFPRNCDPVKL